MSNIKIAGIISLLILILMTGCTERVPVEEGQIAEEIQEGVREQTKDKAWKKTEEAGKETGEEEPEDAQKTKDTDMSSEMQETETGESNSGETEMQNEMEDSLESQVEKYLNQMTQEEKAAQLFVITPDVLTGVDSVTAAGEATRNALSQYPVGGLIYFENNLLSYEQIADMLHTVQQYSEEITGLPLLLAVDEEGGTVARISGKGFGVPEIEDMAVIGENMDYARADEVGQQIGASLYELGFNVDFAPCADVLTNSSNSVVARRSFGSDAQVVADMVSIQMKALKENGVYGVPKHFPGHGSTSEDSHEGYACTYKTLDELLEQELVPFRQAVNEGAEIIMAGHIACPNVTGDNTPASLSGQMIEGVLREQMGYDGLVITDALNMGAIAQVYSSAETAVTAVNAGVDLLLMPADFYSAYQGILDAVSDGRLTQERLDESVRRIIRFKLKIDQKVKEDKGQGI